MYYSLKVSETGVVKIDAYIADCKSFSLGAQAMLFVKNFSDKGVEEMLGMLEETRIATIDIMDVAGLNKERAAEVKKQFSMRFPFRSCHISNEKVDAANVMVRYASLAKKPDLCIVDSETYEDWIKSNQSNQEA